MAVLNGMESEKRWIEDNPQYYDNKAHQQLVKDRVEFRYRGQELLRKLDKVLSKEGL